MNELLREHLTTSVKPPHGGAQAHKRILMWLKLSLFSEPELVPQLGSFTK